MTNAQTLRLADRVIVENCPDGGSASYRIGKQGEEKVLCKAAELS